MRRARIRNSLIVLLVAGCLTGLWWDTVIDLDARQRAYDRIQPGMTLSEVERLMRWQGQPWPIPFHGDPDSPRDPKSGYELAYRWEDARTEVTVRFRKYPEQTPFVSRVWREPKKTPDLNLLLFWRVVIACFWLLSLTLLIRGLLTAKPGAALNSPPSSDTKDDADSPTD